MVSDCSYLGYRIDHNQSLTSLSSKGNIAHVVYMILCLLNNLFAVANMLLGASAVIAFMSVAFWSLWKLLLTI